MTELAVPVDMKIHRSPSVLSNNGSRRKKWVLNKDEINSDMMDEERNKFKVYEYLCHVGEAKEWMERLLKKELAPISEFETQLQYGVTLAELARLFSEESVGKIFESDRLQFRHSDNINYFFQALRNIKFPEIFFFETTDCYEKKNTPKVIYCLHALSHFLELRGYGKAVRDLVGKLEFTDREVQQQMESLKENNINLPTFNNLENKLQEELQKSTFDINVDLAEIKSDDKSDELDDFVPSRSFYRNDSEESLVLKDTVLQKDNQSLQKEIFIKSSQEVLSRNIEISVTPPVDDVKPSVIPPVDEVKPSVNEKTNLIEKTKLTENENEKLPPNEKCIQTDELNTWDLAMEVLKDRRSWIILFLIFTILHSLISKK